MDSENCGTFLTYICSQENKIGINTFADIIGLGDNKTFLKVINFNAAMLAGVSLTINANCNIFRYRGL
jgi:hypothetical protein